MTDSALADHAGNERSSRRALLGAVVGGAAIALAGGRAASAAANSGLSADDLSTAESAIALELTVRDLYDTAIAAGADGDVWHTMREQHESYAQRLAGISGSSAVGRDQSMFEQLSDEFDTSDPAAAAYEVENQLAATHTALLGTVDDIGIAEAMASFVTMQSRHATVLATLSGRSDDFDALFVNAAAAVGTEG